MSNQPIAPLTRAERVDLLFKELMRISEPYHKAVDNYYKVGGVALTALGIITGFIFTQTSQALLGVVPFLALGVVLFETQVRTTIFCASKYMAIMERRINEEAGFPALLYEHQLSLGNYLYYRPISMLLNRGVGFFFFAVVTYALCRFTYVKFLAFLNDFRVNDYFMGYSVGELIKAYQFAFWVTAIWTAGVWLYSFAFGLFIYPRSVEKDIADAKLPIMTPLRKRSSR